MENISEYELKLEKERRAAEVKKAHIIGQLGGEREILQEEKTIYARYINCEITSEECSLEIRKLVEKLCEQYHSEA